MLTPAPAAEPEERGAPKRAEITYRIKERKGKGEFVVATALAQDVEAEGELLQAEFPVAIGVEGLKYEGEES